MARIGDEVLDARVVEHLMRRDGLDRAAARQRAEDTLRLVAASRERADAAGPDEASELAPHRREQLVRAARARLWLQTDFEPAHQPDDIAADDPMLQQARNSARYVHPEVHLVCQVVAMPGPADLDPEQRTAKAADEDWRARASARMAVIEQRLRDTVADDDPAPCDLIRRIVMLSQTEVDGVRVHVESSGFDLDACAEKAPDGTCEKPQFVESWTEQVRKAQGRGFLDPFFTEFGGHLVYVIDILDARSLDDPDTDAYLREQIHEPWQRKAFETYVERLHERKAVRMAAPSALGGAGPPHGGS